MKNGRNERISHKVILPKLAANIIFNEEILDTFRLRLG